MNLKTVETIYIGVSNKKLRDDLVERFYGKQRSHQRVKPKCEGYVEF